MSLLLVIAVSTFAISLLLAFSPFIIKSSLGFIFRKSPEEVVQKHELNRLNEELKVVPMIDEFPRYARLERKIAKLTASISKLCKRRNQQKFYGKFILTSIFYIIQAFFFFWVMYYHRHEKVININTIWTSPIHSILSINTPFTGVVGAGIWMLICRSAISKLLPYVTEVF